jgi:hypothetical protein
MQDLHSVRAASTAGYDREMLLAVSLSVNLQRLPGRGAGIP